MPFSVYFNMLFSCYLSAIETLICLREMSLIGSCSFGFATNTIDDFQNTVLNSYRHCLRQIPQKYKLSHEPKLSQNITISVKNLKYFKNLTLSKTKARSNLQTLPKIQIG